MPRILDKADIEAEREGSALKKNSVYRPLLLGKRIRKIKRQHQSGEIKQTNKVVGKRFNPHAW